MPVFKEQVNIQPINASTGAAQGLMSLADRIDSFGQQTLAYAENELTAKAVKRGKESAAAQKLVKAGGITQAPELKEEHFIGGVEIKAHNKALRASYMASLSNDIRESIGQAQIDSPDDSLQFNAKMDGLRKGILQGVEPQFRNDVGTYFDDKATTAGLNVRKADFAKQSEIAQEEILSAVDNSSRAAERDARNGDMQSAVENQVEAMSFIDEAYSGPEAAEKKRELELGMAEQASRREFDILSDENMQAAYDLVAEKKKKVPKGWTPDEWDTYLNSQNAELNRKQSGLKKELVATEKQIKLGESLERGIQFMNPEIPADPAKSSQDRKDVNLAFDTVSAQWAGMPADQQIDNIEGFVTATGIIPDKVISLAGASMRSGNTEHVIVSSKIINDLAESENASVLRDIPTETRAVALQITSSVAAGMDIEVAAEAARKNTYGLTESDRKRINIETQAIRPDLPGMLTDIVDEHFDPNFWSFQPDVIPAFEADFNVAFEANMVLTDGNSEQAALLATENLRTNWGANDVTGNNELMKYAPSVFYSQPGVGDGWMRDQFVSDVKALGLDPDNVSINVDHNTIASGQPSYPLMHTNEQGIIEPVFAADGSLFPWRPDFSITKEYMEMKSAPARQTKEAIALKNKADKLKQILGQDTEGFL